MWRTKTETDNAEIPEDTRTWRNTRFWLESTRGVTTSVIPLVVEYLEQDGGLAPAVPRNICPEE